MLSRLHICILKAESGSRFYHLLFSHLMWNPVSTGRMRKTAAVCDFWMAKGSHTDTRNTARGTWNTKLRAVGSAGGV